MATGGEPNTTNDLEETIVEEKDVKRQALRESLLPFSVGKDQSMIEHQISSERTGIMLRQNSF